MTDNKSLEEMLPPVFKEILKEKDPDQFIDLLCAQNYFAGNFNNKIPVDNNRIVFELWLEQEKQALIKKISYMFGIPEKEIVAALASKDNVKDRI